MTDREMLEFAARAIGHRVVCSEAEMHGCTDASTIYRGVMLHGVQEPWNPRDDDGDALRLAVKLGIQVRQYPFYDTPRYAAHACESKWCSEAERQVGANALVKYEGSPNAATRLAIVLVAAEVGKTMKEAP